MAKSVTVLHVCTTSAQNVARDVEFPFHVTAAPSFIGTDPNSEQYQQSNTVLPNLTANPLRKSPNREVATIEQYTTFK